MATPRPFALSATLFAAVPWTRRHRHGTLRASDSLSEPTAGTVPLSAKKKTGRPKPQTSTDRLGLRRLGRSNVFELVYPRAVAQRAADMEEVHAMLKAGESEVALDELRWLVGGCGALLEAHKLLGEIAMADGNLELARTHFGYAYELGLDALPRGGLAGRLPYARAANRDFFEAAKGLAWCLMQLGHPKLARQVVDQLLALDPSDPLAVAQLGNT